MICKYNLLSIDSYVNTALHSHSLHNILRSIKDRHIALIWDTSLHVGHK